VYVYDAYGELAAEYATVPESWSGTQYLLADHLGSIRRVAWAHPSQRDFLPFGEEVVPTSAPPALKFTGKERDTESGLDYFGARYYSPQQGRFTSPDEPLADQDPADPQSWSLYSYARNNPLRYIDPSGGSCVDIVGQVTQDGPAGSGPVGDNGDGKGCAAVGVAPSTKEQRERGEDIITPQAVDVHADPQLDPLVATALHQAGVRADAGLSAGLSIMATNAGGIIAGRLIGLGAEALLAARAARIAAADAAEISGVGGQGARASSSRAALAAAEEWVGQGARPIVDRATGQFVGKISADGSKVYRVTSMGKAQPYVNLVNRTTGGNLHVRF
jgi:RHS repeat-associated protein